MGWREWFPGVSPVVSGDAEDEFSRFAVRMNSLHSRLYAADIADKVSNRVNLQLGDLYRQTEGREREMFDRLVDRWLLCGDQAQRSTALALVIQFSIGSAAPAMHASLAYWRSRLTYIESARPTLDLLSARNEARTWSQIMGDAVEALDQKPSPERDSAG